MSAKSLDIDMSLRANMIGSLWMVLAMASFAIEDALIKQLTSVIPVGQAIALFGLFGAVAFALLAMLRGQALFPREVLSRVMAIRAAFEILGRLFYFLALAFAPMSSATVILQATPIVVVAAAAVLFGERGGWLRWVAILVGFVGVLVVLQPGAESFTAASFLAVLGMIGFAGRDLASRAAPKALSVNTLGFYGYLAIIGAGMIYSFWSGAQWQSLNLSHSGFLLAATAWGVLAYIALITAMRTGEVSAVTPFRYSRLVFGIALGVVFFGESLSFAMVAGSCLIVAAGALVMVSKAIFAFEARTPCEKPDSHNAA